MRILLTGGSGFIGKSIMASPLAVQFEILAPSRFELNLLDQLSVEMYLKFYKPDVVIHAATVQDVPEAVDMNTRMFLNLLRMESYYKKLINLSSGAVYDRTQILSGVIEDEIGRSIPTDPYGYSKFLISQIARTHDKVVEMYLFGIYGPGELKSRFITNSIRRVLLGDVPIVYQERVLSFLWIDDFIKIMQYFLAFIEADVPLKPGYNITPTYARSLAGLGRTVIRQVAERKYKDIIIGAGGTAPAYVGSNTRLLALLRSQDVDFSKLFTDYETGIAKLAEWLEKAESVEEAQ